MKTYFVFLTFIASSFFSNRLVLSQPTTVASVWEAHAKVCPKSARQLHGSYGSTKNFDITFCRSEGGNKYYEAYYIGRERATGKSIIVRSDNGRFINGQYEYKVDNQGQSDKCFLQVLRNNKVIFSQSFEEYMFMTNPCDFYQYQLKK